jgi:hypothetical protein
MSVMQYGLSMTTSLLSFHGSHLVEVAGRIARTEQYVEPRTSRCCDSVAGFEYALHTFFRVQDGLCSQYLCEPHHRGDNAVDRGWHLVGSISLSLPGGSEGE